MRRLSDAFSLKVWPGSVGHQDSLRTKRGLVIVMGLELLEASVTISLLGFLTGLGKLLAGIRQYGPCLGASCSKLMDKNRLDCFLDCDGRN